MMSPADTESGMRDAERDKCARAQKRFPAKAREFASLANVNPRGTSEDESRRSSSWGNYLGAPLREETGDKVLAF